MTDKLTEALDRYRDCIESRSFWEDHGTHGDDNLNQARKAEAIARRELVRHFQSV